MNDKFLAFLLSALTVMAALSLSINIVRELRTEPSPVRCNCPCRPSRCPGGLSVLPLVP